jgi:hypothetical protein
MSYKFKVTFTELLRGEDTERKKAYRVDPKEYEPRPAARCPTWLNKKLPTPIKKIVARGLYRKDIRLGETWICITNGVSYKKNLLWVEPIHKILEV